MASHYENFISNLLQKSHINYQKEVSYTDLRGGRFRYDFSTPHGLIEVNGQQHYYEVFGGRSGLLKQQEHDRRKISYALANCIPLYIIPFWDIYSLTSAHELFQDKYRAKSRWHNDEVWREHQNSV